ncbi:aminoacyl-histidine dipeptidase [Flavobacteriales bacterium]|nr:aminoacyl-histidine dipeptidase [Flavobacteriales bacterium]
MKMKVRDLLPVELWNNFEDLNAVPRPSKKEERVIEFIKNFGLNLGLSTYVDPCGNVIIKKPASKGSENQKTVIIQSHLDMVHQKNADTEFDFLTQGIQSYIDGDWVTAKGTTLGADNGMGVATIMTLLASSTIQHPSIEALFTIDEETGMTGAFELEKGILEGEILLNLDTEDDDEFSIGCAGGIDTNTLKLYKQEKISGGIGFEIIVKGLKGGHSGMDIHLERGNANKIMNRILALALNYNLQLSQIDGGSLRNAIPRESVAKIVVDSKDFLNQLDDLAAEIKSEFFKSEPDLIIEVNNIDSITHGLSKIDSNEVVNAIYSVFNGVFKMSQSIDGLVETSSSLARVILKEGSFITQSLQRSSVESSKLDIAKTIGASFLNIGAEFEHSGSYPGWAPNTDSEILDIMVSLYKNMFGSDPKVQACHAGLECGILNERYPGLDMISFGPTIKNPHSPDEKVHIASVQKFWSLFVEVLKVIPFKN